MKPFKQPVSVLVVIHTADGRVLLMERADKSGYWQSVTGSREGDEALRDTVKREVMEETGLDVDAYELTDWQESHVYEIYPHWRHRYAPGTTHNTEHVFSLKLPDALPVRLAEREHLQYCWLPAREAAEKAFSPTNSAAILKVVEA
jgi:dATP pyrophosphohydrolase